MTVQLRVRNVAYSARIRLNTVLMIAFIISTLPLVEKAIGNAFNCYSTLHHYYQCGDYLFLKEMRRILLVAF